MAERPLLSCLRRFSNGYGFLHGNCVPDNIRLQPNDERAIGHIPDYADRMARSKVVIDKAREVGIPVVFIQEIQRANLIDMGREADGDEDVHCLDSNRLTAVAEGKLGMRADDYPIYKRRYSALLWYGSRNLAERARG